MRVLARCLLEQLVFLEVAEEAQLDPHVAVKMLEQAADTLRSSSPAELAALRHAAAELAQAEAREGGCAARRAFFQGFVSAMGLEPEDESERPGAG